MLSLKMEIYLIISPGSRSGCDPQRGEERHSRQEARRERPRLHTDTDTHTASLPEVTQLEAERFPPLKQRGAASDSRRGRDGDSEGAKRHNLSQRDETRLTQAAMEV